MTEIVYTFISKYAKKVILDYVRHELGIELVFKNLNRILVDYYTTDRVLLILDTECEDNYIEIFNKKVIEDVSKLIDELEEDKDYEVFTH